MVVSHNPLWVLSKPSIHLSIPGIGKKSSLPSIALKQLTLALLTDKYAATVHVYTDGSVTASRSTAAVVIPSLCVTRGFTLDHKTTSTATELVAIREAIRLVSRESPQAWTLFCDSKPALQVLNGVMRQGPYYALAAEVLELCSLALQQGHVLTIQWVPGHCGLAGNDWADQEAKKVSANADVVRLPFARTDTTALLSTILRHASASHWSHPDNRHGRLHRLDPDCKFRLPPGIQRNHATLFHRLRLGVAFTRRYKHLIGVTSDPDCETCHVPETISHVLCHCPRYAHPREQLARTLARLDCRVVSEEVLLGPWPDAKRSHKAFKAVLTFLRSSGLSEIL